MLNQHRGDNQNHRRNHFGTRVKLVQPAPAGSEMSECLVDNPSFEPLCPPPIWQRHVAELN
jgi:hypothetical protein